MTLVQSLSLEGQGVEDRPNTQLFSQKDEHVPQKQGRNSSYIGWKRDWQRGLLIKENWELAFRNIFENLFNSITCFLSLKKQGRLSGAHTQSKLLIRKIIPHAGSSVLFTVNTIALEQPNERLSGSNPVSQHRKSCCLYQSLIQLSVLANSFGINEF